jgi:hypothetical protein
VFSAEEVSSYADYASGNLPRWEVVGIGAVQAEFHLSNLHGFDTLRLSHIVLERTGNHYG